MSKRKKVIAALSECNPFNQCYEERCPYYKDNNCLESLHEDILKLLKEQEPVAPKKQEETRIWTVCGNCSQHLISKWTYCPYCGQAVKWDD